MIAKKFLCNLATVKFVEYWIIFMLGYVTLYNITFMLQSTLICYSSQTFQTLLTIDGMFEYLI